MCELPLALAYINWAPIDFVVGSIAGPCIGGVPKKVLNSGEVRELFINCRSSALGLTLEKIVGCECSPRIYDRLLV
jgi:hypothetical protein